MAPPPSLSRQFNTSAHSGHRDSYALWGNNQKRHLSTADVGGAVLSIDWKAEPDCLLDKNRLLKPRLIVYWATKNLSPECEPLCELYHLHWFQLAHLQ